jgi:hypothetical protein
VCVVCGIFRLNITFEKQNHKSEFLYQQCLCVVWCVCVNGVRVCVVCVCFCVCGVCKWCVCMWCVCVRVCVFGGHSDFIEVGLKNCDIFVNNLPEGFPYLVSHCC